MIDWPIHVESDYGKLLAAFVEFTHRKVIVEIGVACGVTTKLLCEAARTNYGHVYGFDIWAQHGRDGQFLQFCARDYVENFLHSKGITNFTLQQCNTRSSEFGTILKKTCPLVDFAFIDGDHSYEGLKSDFDNVYPLLAPDGIVAFHDSRTIDGCREFVLDLRTRLNDGTYDIFDLPWGYQERKVGVSILVKRTYHHTDNQLALTEQCGSLSTLTGIISRESKWYHDQQLTAQLRLNSDNS